MKKSAPISLLVVAILYMLCNVAYFAAGTENSPVASMASEADTPDQFQKKTS